MEARLTNCVRTQFEFSSDENIDLYPKGMAAQGPSTVENHLGWTYLSFTEIPEASFKPLPRSCEVEGEKFTLLGYIPLFLDLIIISPSSSLFHGILFASYLNDSIRGYIINSL